MFVGKVDGGMAVDLPVGADVGREASLQDPLVKKC